MWSCIKEQVLLNGSALLVDAQCAALPRPPCEEKVLKRTSLVAVEAEGGLAARTKIREHPRY